MDIHPNHTTKHNDVPKTQITIFSKTMRAALSLARRTNRAKAKRYAKLNSTGRPTNTRSNMMIDPILIGIIGFFAFWAVVAYVIIKETYRIGKFTRNLIKKRQRKNPETN